MAYEDRYIEAAERRRSVKTIVLLGAFTVITGIALSSFLVALYYSLTRGHWPLASLALGGTAVVLFVYYRGLETIVTATYRT